MNKKEFKRYVSELGIELSLEQERKLEEFYELLISWNEKINLTRIVEKEDVYLKHFYDSLTLSKIIDLNKIETLCDVGTGAGFPGIVLKIVYPHLNITLIDSLQKRVNYLNEVVKELKLENIKAIHVRAEDHKKQYDLVTARAVAKLDKLLDYTGHLVKSSGLFIPMKANINDEIKEAEKKLKKLKMNVVEVDEFLLPIENSTRTLIKIQKN